MRYVSPSEFVRQAPREIRKYVRSEPIFAEVLDDGAMIVQLITYRVSTGGAWQTVKVRGDTCRVGNDYDFWMLGRSREHAQKGMKIREQVGQHQRDRVARNVSESNAEFVDKFVWEVNKESGNGIHVSGS